MKYSAYYKVAKTLRKAGVRFDPSKCPEVVNMRKTIASLNNGAIQFTVSQEPNGDWIAESVNIRGILTGGTAKDSIEEMIKDAVFTYFEIPAKYCDDALIREAGEPVIIKQQVFATA